MNNYDFGPALKARLGSLFLAESSYGAGVFANLIRLITGRTTTAYENDFVQQVRIIHRTPRSARATRFMLLGWMLIALKCWAVVWLVHHFHVPINPLWVTVPTVIFAGVCTAIFFRGE